MTETQAVSLDRLFHALADPGRRGMIDQLSRGPASVKELAAPQALALPSALKHLRVLEEGGLVRSHKTGRVRTFRLEAEALRRVERWVAARKEALDHQFDRLEAYLAAGSQDHEDGTE